jgi:hypothetical protein
MGHAFTVTGEPQPDRKEITHLGIVARMLCFVSPTLGLWAALESLTQTTHATNAESLRHEYENLRAVNNTRHALEMLYEKVGCRAYCASRAFGSPMSDCRGRTSAGRNRKVERRTDCRNAVRYR